MWLSGILKSDWSVVAVRYLELFNELDLIAEDWTKSWIFSTFEANVSVVVINSDFSYRKSNSSLNHRLHIFAGPHIKYNNVFKRIKNKDISK